MPYLIDSLQKSFLQLRAQMETNAVLPVNIQSVYLNNFTQSQNWDKGFQVGQLIGFADNKQRVVTYFIWERLTRITNNEIVKLKKIKTFHTVQQ